MKRKYTDEDLVREFEKAVSLSDLVRKLGLVNIGRSLGYIKDSCDRLGLDWRSKKNQGSKGRKFTKGFKRQYTNEDVFKKGSKYGGSSTQIKERALEMGYIKDYCEICGQGKIWNGKELVIILDHIDGDRTNHSPENLRSVCPNCDIQLPTSRGRNAKRLNV